MGSDLTSPPFKTPAVHSITSVRLPEEHAGAFLSRLQPHGAPRRAMRCLQSLEVQGRRNVYLQPHLPPRALCGFRAFFPSLRSLALPDCPLKLDGAKKLAYGVRCARGRSAERAPLLRGR